MNIVLITFFMVSGVLVRLLHYYNKRYFHIKSLNSVTFWILLIIIMVSIGAKLRTVGADQYSVATIICLSSWLVTYFTPSYLSYLSFDRWFLGVDKTFWEN